MKICFISHSSRTGGAERVLLETIEVVQNNGIECRVLLPSHGDVCAELNRLGVPYDIISYPLWMTRGSASLFLVLKALLNIPKDTILVAWKILRWKCDLVYSNTVTVSIGAFAAFLVNRPHIWHIHEFGSEDHGLSFLFGAGVSLRILNRLSKRCIFVSNALARKYERYVPISKVAVIYPSMHRAHTDRSSAGCMPPSPDHARPFRLAVIGTLMPGKAQEIAILAVAELRRTGLAAELALVGNGSAQYRLHLEAIIRSQHLEGYVSFAGQVENVAHEMRVADAIVVCSKSEAFGRATIEAMLIGKVVIGARSGATAELIRDGFNGVLYAPGDSSDLARKIRYVSENSIIAHVLGRNAQRWAEQLFNSRRYTEDLVPVLSSCFAQNKRKPPKHYLSKPTTQCRIEMK